MARLRDLGGGLFRGDARIGLPQYDALARVAVQNILVGALGAHGPREVPSGLFLNRIVRQVIGLPPQDSDDFDAAPRRTRGPRLSGADRFQTFLLRERGKLRKPPAAGPPVGPNVEVVAGSLGLSPVETEVLQLFLAVKANPSLA